MKSIETGQKVFSVKYKNFNYEPEIPPIENFNNMEKAIGYKTYYKRVKSNMSDFYKKARVTCVKFIKKLVEEYRFSSRTFVAAVFYLDLIYLNYDYYTTLKEFKSEMMAVGCFLVAVKFVEIKPEVPNYRKIKMFTFKEVSYEMNEIRKYEDYVLKFLSFKLNFYTTFTIIEYLLSNGVIMSNEFHSDENSQVIREKVRRVNKLSFQILINFIEDSSYINFNHIDVAFSCVVFAKELLKFKDVFTPELEKIYNLKMGNFVRCYQYVSSINKKLKHDMSERVTVIGRNIYPDEDKKESAKEAKESRRQEKKEATEKIAKKIENKTRNNPKKINSTYTNTNSTNVNSGSSYSNTNPKGVKRSNTLSDYKVLTFNKLGIRKKLNESSDGTTLKPKTKSSSNHATSILSSNKSMSMKLKGNLDTDPEHEEEFKFNKSNIIHDQNYYNSTNNDLNYITNNSNRANVSINSNSNYNTAGSANQANANINSIANIEESVEEEKKVPVTMKYALKISPNKHHFSVTVSNKPQENKLISKSKQSTSKKLKLVNSGLNSLNTSMNMDKTNDRVSSINKKANIKYLSTSTPTKGLYANKLAANMNKK